MELLRATNTKPWLGQKLNDPIDLKTLEEIINRRIDILIDARDKLNERKLNIRRKLEAMETIKEGERIAPSFFRKMKTNFKKEEIYTLVDNKKQVKETTNQDETNDFATDFYTDLWKNRQGTREFSERRRLQMITKIQHRIAE